MKNLASIILLLGILSTGDVSSQAKTIDTQNQEVETLISQLSWNAIGMNCNSFGTFCAESDAAKKLVQIGKPATKKLLNVLEDKNKAIAAHVILTQIWEPNNVKGTVRFGIHKFIFVLNGLEWEQIFKRNNSEYKVEKNVLNRNAIEWYRKIYDISRKNGVSEMPLNRIK